MNTATKNSRVKFSSSRISEGYYNPHIQAMDLTFNNEKVYRYYDVPLEVWVKLINADSVGKAFESLIKGKYEYEQLP